jgi:hypothetical protein
MSDFLTRLALRQLGQIASVATRVPEVFAPPPTVTPQPIVEEIPAQMSDSGRMSLAPTPVVNPNSARHPIAGTSNTWQEEPTRAANPAQRLVARASEPPVSPFSIENMSAEVASFADPKPGVAPKTDLPLRPQSNPGQRGLLRSRSEGSASLTGGAQPLLMTAERVAVAAPPRLEPKLSGRDQIAARERAAADFESPVQVTIGRIEVTALTQPAPAKRVAAPRKPAMSLDDYLARRQRGER